MLRKFCKSLVFINPPDRSFIIGGGTGEPLKVPFVGFGLTHFVGIEEGLLLSRDAVLAAGTDPLYMHFREINEQVAAGGPLLVPSLLPNQLHKGITGLVSAPDAQVGVDALWNAAMTPRATCTRLLDQHAAIIEHLFIRFMVQKHRRELQLLLELAHIPEHKPHKIRVFVDRMVVADRINDKNVRFSVADKTAQVRVGFFISLGRVQKQGIERSAYNLKLFPKLYSYIARNHKLLESLMTPLRPKFAVQVQYLTRPMHRKERLAFLTVFLTVRAEQWLLQHERQRNIERKYRLAALRLASDQPSPTFGEQAVSNNAGRRKRRVCGEFVSGEQGHIWAQ